MCIKYKLVYFCVFKVTVNGIVWVQLLYSIRGLFITLLNTRQYLLLKLYQWISLNEFKPDRGQNPRPHVLLEISLPTKFIPRNAKDNLVLPIRNENDCNTYWVHHFLRKQSSTSILLTGIEVIKRRTIEVSSPNKAKMFMGHYSVN